MAYGGLIKITDKDGNTSIAINATAVVYSKAIEVKQGIYFGLKSLLASSGSPTVKVELQQSDVLPATEGSASNDWVVPDSMPDVFSNLNDKVNHIKSLSPVPMKYLRLKFTGLATNPADTTYAGSLFIQDLLN